MQTFDEKEKLGDGHFGQVFLGTFNGMPVAVKKIDLRSPVDSHVALIKNEIDIQSQLNHSNIVKLMDSFQGHDVYQVVLEWMDLGDLFSVLIKNGSPLSSYQCLGIARDVAAALNYMHDQGFLHRDIKMENILINSHQQAKIADFGFAISETNALTDELCGTIECIAPELAKSLIDGKKKFQYSRLTDVFALGIALLKALIYKAPYPEMDDKLIWKHIAKGNHHPAPKETQPELAVIVSACLINTPNDRVDTKGIESLLNATISPAVDGFPHIIHLCAQHGWLTIIEQLVTMDPKLIEVKDAYQQTALLWAASRGHGDVVSYFVSKGADINNSTETHENNEAIRKSALDWAIEGKHDNCISILQNQGAIAYRTHSFFNQPPKAPCAESEFSPKVSDLSNYPV